MNMQMNLVGESIFSHAVGEVAVRYSKDGMVSPLWLSACEEERNLTKGLMEKIADPLNLQKAYKRVRSNAGSAGVDGMHVKELGKWLSVNYQQLQTDLLQGNYHPKLYAVFKSPSHKAAIGS
jgi:RNA-directed DNA polymerase